MEVKAGRNVAKFPVLYNFLLVGCSFGSCSSTGGSVLS